MNILKDDTSKDYVGRDFPTPIADALVDFVWREYASMLDCNQPSLYQRIRDFNEKTIRLVREALQTNQSTRIQISA